MIVHYTMNLMYDVRCNIDIITSLNRELYVISSKWRAGKSYESNISSLLLTTLISVKGDLQTIFRFSYLKIYKLITLGTKFKNL